MRKRILALAMTTAMVLGGTACGGSDAATESASTSQAATEKQNTGESENGDSTHIYVLTAPEGTMAGQVLLQHLQRRKSRK